MKETPVGCFFHRHAHADVLYREVTPGGFREIQGVEGSIAQVREEIDALESWEVRSVEAAPAGGKARVRAVVKRDLACAGALAID